MPAQDCVRRDDGGDRFQGSPAKGLAFGGESASLIVGEEYSLPAGLELLFEDSILFDQVGDCAGLLKSCPASKGGQEELQLDCGCHLASLSPVP